MPDIFTPPHDKKEEKEPQKTEQQPMVANEKPVNPPTKVAVEEKIEELKEEEHTPLVQKDAIDNTTHPAKELLKHDKNQVGLLSHYCEKPTGLTFANQEPDEDIIIFLRRHFATNIPWLAITAILLLLPIFVFALFSASNFTLFAIPVSIIIIMTAFYYLIVLNYALLNFINWFYDIGIISKKRLIDLDANNILHHHFAETDIHDIVDVSVTQQGLFSSVFNYGNVHIQTEAVKANFEYVAAPKPSTVADFVNDLKELIAKEGKNE